MARTEMFGCKEYFAPNDLKSACALAADLDGDAVVIAGGSVLGSLPRPSSFGCLCAIDLKNIGGLDAITARADGGAEIGALVRLGSIAENGAVRRTFRENIAPALEKYGVETLASAAVNGGAASAFMEAARAANASFVIKGADHEHVCPASEFYIKDGSGTILTPGDIIESLRIPPEGGAVRGEHHG